MEKKHDKHPDDNGDKKIEQQEETAQETVGTETMEQLKEQLAAREAEAASNWDKFVRERADLENFRKRVQKEKEELLKYGNESLLGELLPVIDNMERALAHACDEVCDDKMNAVLEGIRLTHGMLLGAMKKFGVTPLESTRGASFDPAFHQAMCQVENDELPANSIVEEFQKGYLLNERLLRPAMVSVAIPPKNEA